MKFAIAALAAAAIAALAQEGRGRGVSPLFSALDTNHDGLLSSAEIDHAPAALKTLDKNGDGIITRDELMPRFGGRRGFGRGGSSAGNPDDMVETLMAFDENHDGKLSKDELPERMRGIFDTADTNHDGYLTPDEIRKAPGAQSSAPDRGDDGEGRAEGRGRGFGGGGFAPDPIMAALDTNRDGRISADEIAQAPAALRKLDTNGDGQITQDEVRPQFGRGN